MSLGLAGAAAVLLVLLFGWMHGNSIKADIKRLKNESNALEKKLPAATKMIEAAEAVEEWTREEVVWLDELRWFSERFPDAEEVMLTQLELNPSRDGRPGNMAMEGLARNVDSLKAMDRALQDDSHQVVGEGESQSGSRDRYSTRFERAVILEQED
jgi:hypothetical protein